MHPILLDFTVPGVGFHVRLPAYGFFLALAFLSAIQLGHVRAMKKGLDPELMGNFYVVLILSSMLGARATYVALEWQRFADRPWEALLLWKGGLVFYGGLLGGFLGCYAFVRWARMSALAMADLAAPCIALGHAVGRLGCYFNGCCHGVPTSGPFGVAFPYTTGDYQLRHPTQLYETAGLIVIVIVLSRIFWRAHRPGAVAVWYALTYAPLRFVVEMYRGDARGGFLYGLSPSQVGSVVALAAGLLVWALQVRFQSVKEVELAGDDPPPKQEVA